MNEVKVNEEEVKVEPGESGELEGREEEEEPGLSDWWQCGGAGYP